MATCEPRLTTETVESPLPRDWYGGFGERSGETGRWQHRNRAPGRLNSRISGGAASPSALRHRVRVLLNVRLNRSGCRYPPSRSLNAPAAEREGAG
jgi:hypothetical protein